MPDAVRRCASQARLRRADALRTDCESGGDVSSFECSPTSTVGVRYRAGVREAVMTLARARNW